MTARWPTRRPDAVRGRLRRVLLIVGGLEILVAVWGFWESSLSQGFRMWLSGYEGCGCADCSAQFVVGSYYWPSHYVPLPLGRATDVEDLVPRLALVGVLTCLGAFSVRWLPVPTARDSFGCLSCGYDLRGLRGKRCPECGAVNKD